MHSEQPIQLYSLQNTKYVKIHKQLITIKSKKTLEFIKQKVEIENWTESIK